jgi:hypothetical protein
MGIQKITVRINTPNKKLQLLIDVIELKKHYSLVDLPPSNKCGCWGIRI